MDGQLNWLKGGILLGLIFLLAVWLVKPIGVSTQFVIFDGIIWNIFSEEIIQENHSAASGYTSPNAYLDKSGGKYAGNAANPLNYGFIFALSMIFGAFLSNKTKGPKPTRKDRVAPEVWRSKFGDTSWKRYLAVFFSGFLVLLGARLAGGCTSGHMMSGIMQTSISGYLFAAGAFLTAVPAAIFIYRRKERA
ncbi:MAG: YeeE/YedE family protein [Candidatus Marinimicrobia bacterium]|nr:YeeE/YedE family protein [Candidatus Neomarinimicrobiota bacterium]